MQALRTLPLLRPSRSSSPAPGTNAAPTTQTQSTTVPGSMGPPTVNGKPRSRSLTKPLSSLHLSLGGVPTSQPPTQPPTPAAVPTSRPPTPKMAAAALPAGAAPVQDNGHPAGFMDAVGLRLNEQVNKACVGVDWKSRKGFKKSAGWQVGESVINALPAPASDPYLMRAILRTSVRSLSIYLSRLESLLLPALTCPTFAAPLVLLPIKGAAGSPLNPTQLFAVSIAHAAWETCEILEQTLEQGTWPRFAHETLRPVMDKFDSVVGRVVQPILGGLKRDLVASLGMGEGTSPPGGKTVGLASVTVPAATTASAQALGLPAPPTAPHPAGVKQLAIPVCLQHFASRVDASRKVLETVAAPCQDDGEAWTTGVVVAVVWRGMCLLADKDASSNGPPSPGSISRALSGLATPTVTPKLPLNPLSILPSRAASRPPSPPRNGQAPSQKDPLTHALLSYEGLIHRLVTGLVQPPTQVGSDPNSEEHLAREALAEALEALTSLRIASAASHAPEGMLSSVRRIRDDVDSDDAAQAALDDALEDLPVVTLLTFLQRKANLALTASGRPASRTVAELWGWSAPEYERQVLSGFGAAEEWGPRFANALRAEVERQLAASPAGGLVDGEAREWLKVVGVAIEATTGIKVAGAQ